MILVATAMATAAAVRDGRHEARATRARVAEPAIRGLASDVSQSASTLDDLRSFFEASNDVTRLDFERFTAGPLTRQASLQYLAWDPLGGGEPFRATRAGAPEGLPSLSAARGELDAARDSAQPRMTAPLTTPGGERVVLVVSPVYAPGAEITTVARRRAALTGFVSGAALLRTVGASAEAGLPAGARIHVRDGDATVIGSGTDGGETAGTIDVAGRHWTVALAGVGGASVAMPVAVASAGLLLAAIVGLLFVEAVGRERGVREELALLRVRHDRILAAAGDGIIGVDEGGRAAFVNPAAARMLGWSVDELTGRPLDEAAMPTIAATLREGAARSGERDAAPPRRVELPRRVHDHADRERRGVGGHLPRRHRPQAAGGADPGEPRRRRAAGRRRSAHRPRQPPHLPRAPAHGGRSGRAATAAAWPWC